MEQTLLAKAKNAKSVDELLRLAEENKYPLTEEEAKDLYKQLHEEGEISDDELDDVAGGGCKTKVNGHKYTVVTNLCDCFTGQHELGFIAVLARDGNVLYGKCKNTDNVDLRIFWATSVPILGKVCGNCKHLRFKAGTGYCGVS